MITNSTITWVKVEKPIFDLAGVLSSALGMAGLCALVACVLGCAWGALLIRRRSRALPPEPFLTLRVTHT